MNCTGNCNQGRSCDCGKSNVALGIFWFVVVAICTIAIAFIALTQSHDVTVQYDCRISEISPDVPMAVKEKCRRLMEK